MLVPSKNLIQRFNVIQHDDTTEFKRLGKCVKLVGTIVRIFWYKQSITIVQTLVSSQNRILVMQGTRYYKCTEFEPPEKMPRATVVQVLG